MATYIPVIDFAEYSLNIQEKDVSAETLKQLAEEICTSFKNVGFLYLKNHGISESQVLKLQDMTRAFFNLPHEVKQKYACPGRGLDNNYGWSTLEREIVNPERPGDLKEIFDILTKVEQKWPETELPEFKPFMMEMVTLVSQLCNRILHLLGVGLHLKDTELFRRNHNPLTNKCSTTARVLHYPVVPDKEIKEKQLRCGEHTDYGSITLLIQDDVGGLEVKNSKGEFVPATPIPGTIVVNVADLMQRWTSDQLVSTVHRVVTPAGQKGGKEGRISFAYFAQPDDECLIECIDGSNKYEPVKSGTYRNMRLTSTFAY